MEKKREKKTRETERNVDFFFFFLGVDRDVARRHNRAAARLARNRRTHGFCNCGQMALKEKEGANPTEPSKPECDQLAVFCA
ncbi:hypothetical protein [Pandoravirus japonicus]|uniref:Uncharacterized protein n=1 Tax=Pandoravirus japonicus TaxID=2823154 RepID=A0A811BS34_9VIRU|nr:hypothetical protein [Pandoravirus japonicus]